MRSLRAFLVTAVLLIIGHFATVTNTTRITLKDNAYSNIVVAISPDIPNIWAETILKNIQETIERASSVLYRATKKRSYFKDVRILIPETWSNVRANASTWETYSVADVRVAPASSIHGDVPYTVQSGGCGQHGEYIHLTPGYVRTIGQKNNTATFGPSEKVFVHQWAHLRYGVFDEYGMQGDKRYPLFFKDQHSGNSVPNLCTNLPPIYTVRDVNTQGSCRVDPVTGVYDENCIYDLKPEFHPDSSLMAITTRHSVVHFCEEGQELNHIFNAPTKHNALCGTDSVWSVISRHPDFAKNNNPPKEEHGNLKPTFQIVKSTHSRFVLVADTSGSMINQSRIARLRESSHRWIKYELSNGSSLGLVQFSTKAQILSQMVQITGEESRQSLIRKLPVAAEGWTCIGCGLQKALDILTPTGPGGVIILLTDGQETHQPSIDDVLPNVIKSGVRIVSIAFGRLAEGKLEELAQKTNGKSYFIDDNNASQGLNDAFTGSLTYQPAVPADQIIVLLFQRQYQDVKGNVKVTGSFGVDHTVGRNFVFRLDYTKKESLRSFSLTSPTNKVYTTLEYDEVAKAAMVKLDEAQVGMWNFVITVNSSTVETIAVFVTSQTRSTTTTPITTECYVSGGSTANNATSSPIKILAKVMQGMNPVIRALVKARIEGPKGPPAIIELYDKGAFADTTANDGIYSRYFVAANVQGRYTVECEIWNANETFISNGPITQFNVDLSSRTNPHTSLRTTEALGSFGRITSGGSFKVTQPVLNVFDPYPPSRITDLFIVNVGTSPINRSITIQFTAPGEDLDWGTAASYEIKYSHNFSDLREPNFFNTGNNSTLVQPDHLHANSSLKPLPSGSNQTITFYLKEESQYNNNVYYVAIRAVDRSGQKASASNIVTASFPESSSGLSTTLIVAITIVCILGVLLIVGMAYLIAKKRYGSYHKTATGNTDPKP